MSQPLGDPAHHFFLTRGVARCMGVSLGEAMQAGHLAPDAYSTMVTRCRACPMVENCMSWLADQAALSDTPPDGCCNADQFLRLRALMA